MADDKKTKGSKNTDPAIYADDGCSCGVVDCKCAEFNAKYVSGFMAKCAELGVDPEALLEKDAQLSLSKILPFLKQLAPKAVGMASKGVRAVGKTTQKGIRGAAGQVGKGVGTLTGGKYGKGMQDFKGGDMRKKLTQLLYGAGTIGTAGAAGAAASKPQKKKRFVI